MKNDDHTHNDAGGARALVRRNALLFLAIAILWILLDRATKAYFDSGAFTVGKPITDSFMGLFRFLLVHNTGAAWGIFSDSTVALGVLSIIVCALIIVFAFVIERNLSLGCIVGLSLVFAGGIGNAIDRFVYGYVVDFIEFTFVDFPVFNIADIGVTCGVVIFLVSYIAFVRTEGKVQR